MSEQETDDMNYGHDFDESVEDEARDVVQAESDATQVDVPFVFFYGPEDETVKRICQTLQDGNIGQEGIRLVQYSFSSVNDDMTAIKDRDTPQALGSYLSAVREKFAETADHLMTIGVLDNDTYQKTVRVFDSATEERAREIDALASEAGQEPSLFPSLSSVSNLFKTPYKSGRIESQKMFDLYVNAGNEDWEKQSGKEYMNHLESMFKMSESHPHRISGMNKHGSAERMKSLSDYVAENAKLEEIRKMAERLAEIIDAAFRKVAAVMGFKMKP